MRPRPCETENASVIRGEFHLAFSVSLRHIVLIRGQWPLYLKIYLIFLQILISVSTTSFAPGTLDEMNAQLFYRRPAGVILVVSIKIQFSFVETYIDLIIHCSSFLFYVTMPFLLISTFYH